MLISLVKFDAAAVYKDPELGVWVRRLGEILTDCSAMEQCRREHLSPAEFAQVQREIEDIRQNGL